MKTVIIKIDEKTYEELLAKAKSEGFLTISEYLRALLMRSVGKETQVKETEKTTSLTSEKLIQLLERRIQDKINPFTSKIDELSRKYGEFIERLEAIEEKLKSLEEKVAIYQQGIEKTAAKKAKEISKKSAIDILREQKVIFERDIATRIRDRDSFFSKLEREGAKVIEGKDERIAVEPTYWQEFVKKIENLSTNNDEEIQKILDAIELRLFKKLKESALLVYNTSLRKWQILI
ncbi:hypothetical protein QPL79_08055 [Ignisphaera sp. 4213-co]|uniref:Ribbon-helix-helix protein, CopG family n=1 Tax=Ignisphaera cupida TaxID=3050454 RepID=A0ABD4Z9S2_9CREN|nr:hypothetical protein [Ignisphaera sp. 4213-co]MDK6029313.1 hypothetical protein [Ignisphaera sp. 4213-co]